MKPIGDPSNAMTDAASPLPTRSEPLAQALEADQPAVVRTIECREAAPEGSLHRVAVANPPRR